MGYQGSKIVNVIGKRIFIILGLVGQAAAKMVRDDYPERFRQMPSQVSIIIRPGWIAVDQYDRLTVTFIEIVKAASAAKSQVVWSEAIIQG